MLQGLNTKLLIGLLAAVAALGVLIARDVNANKQTAAATTRLADERDKAAQIDQADREAVEKIRQQQRQRASSTQQK